MKKDSLFVSAAIALSMLLVSPAVSAKSPVFNNGISPVTAASESTSRIPKSAQHFLDKYFSGIDVTKTEVQFPSQNVEVTLADGTEIEFSSKGKVIDLDAPDDAVISDNLLRHLVSREIYRDLKKRKLQDCVEGVTHDQYGYKIELYDEAYDEARYADAGYLIAIYTED